MAIGDVDSVLVEAAEAMRAWQEQFLQTNFRLYHYARLLARQIDHFALSKIQAVPLLNQLEQSVITLQKKYEFRSAKQAHTLSHWQKFLHAAQHAWNEDEALDLASWPLTSEAVLVESASAELVEHPQALHFMEAMPHVLHTGQHRFRSHHDEENAKVLEQRQHEIAEANARLREKIQHQRAHCAELRQENQHVRQLLSELSHYVSELRHDSLFQEEVVTEEVSLELETHRVHLQEVANHMLEKCAELRNQLEEAEALDHPFLPKPEQIATVDTNSPVAASSYLSPALRYGFATRGHTDGA
jgi:hypothetical protein